MNIDIEKGYAVLLEFYCVANGEHHHVINVHIMEISWKILGVLCCENIRDLAS